MRNHPTKAGRSIKFELLASLDLGAGICVFIMRTQVPPFFESFNLLVSKALKLLTPKS